MKKKNNIRILAQLFALAVFASSCSVFLKEEFSPSEPAPQTPQAPTPIQSAEQAKNGVGVLTGSLALSFPARTILPKADPPASYRVTCTKDGAAPPSEAIATVDASGNGTTFSVPLSYGTWNVLAEGLNEGDGVIFLSQSQSVTISEENPTASISLTLKYVNTGTGNIQLEVGYATDAGISSIEWWIDSDANVQAAADSSGKLTISKTDVTCGSHTLLIEFFDSKGISLFKIAEKVQVYQNQTSSFVTTDAPYIEGNAIKVTKDLIERSKHLTVYVGGTGLMGAAANDSATGTLFDPVATLSRALSILQDASPAPAEQCRIIICADVEESRAIDIEASSPIKKLAIESKTGGHPTVTGAGSGILIDFNVSGAEIAIQNVDFNKTRLGFSDGNSVTFENCTFSNNSASDAKPNGGAIYLGAGTATFTACTFTENSATYGGAIYCDASTSLTATDCTFTGNTAATSGGAVYCTGSFSFSGENKFEKNKVTTGASGNGGGAIFFENSSANFDVAGAIFTENSCKADGGAIYIRAAKEATINSTFTGNRTEHGGGAIFGYGSATSITILEGEFSKNVATGEGDHTFGGAVKLYTGKLTVKGGTFTQNEAEKGGGAICLESAKGEIQGGTFSGNTATNGGAFYCKKADSNSTLKVSAGSVSENSASENGGAAYIEAGSALEISGGGFSENTAATYGGAIYANGASVTLTDCTIGDPEASAAATDTNFSNKAQKGGGVYITGSGSLAISGTTSICHNYATDSNAGGGGIYAACPVTISGGKINYNSGIGGGIYFGNGGTLSILDGEIKGNHSSVNGGGIYSYGASNTITMTGGTISENTAKNNGGGICNSNSSNLTISGGEIRGNTATGYGGGVHNSSGTLTISGGTISGNTASTYGGGVYAYGGTLTITDGTISTNNAENGGGICNSNSSNLTISGGEISGNTADYGGGVCNYSTLTISGGEIRGNTATNNGGGVCNSGGTLKMLGAAKVDSGNDVYLTDGKYITITGALDAATSTAAKITLPSYALETKVLDASGYTLTQDDCDKFLISNDEWGVKLSSGTGVLFTLFSPVYLDGHDKGNGSDTNSGADADHPVKTLKMALTLLKKNATPNPVIILTNRYEINAENFSDSNLDFSDTEIYPTPIVLKRGFTSNYMLDVNQSGVNVVAKNVIFDGDKENHAANYPLLQVVSGTLTLDDGAIVQNAKNPGSTKDGGGVEVLANGTLIMKTGSKITNCESESNGGGIFSKGTVTIAGGEISGNKTQRSGGGIANFSNGKLNISGGTISGNEVIGTTGLGGGGICNNASTLTITGGTISGNKTTTETKGSGIYNSYSFNMSGAAKIDPSNDVYLPSDKYITITGPLTAAAPVAVITPDSYTEGTQVLAAGGVTINDEICQKFSVTPKSGTYPWEIKVSSAKGVLARSTMGGGG